MRPNAHLNAFRFSGQHSFLPPAAPFLPPAAKVMGGNSLKFLQAWLPDQ